MRGPLEVEYFNGELRNSPAGLRLLGAKRRFTAGGPDGKWHKTSGMGF